jgi:hypothetical protein
MTEGRAALILKNLLDVPRIDHQVERLLQRVAETRLEDVWDYFGQRIQREKTDDGDKYDAVPFRFHGLEKALSQNAAMAIQKGRGWYAKDSRLLFQFRGGRVVSNAFPICTTEFADALTRLVETGDSNDADFVLAVLQNYLGEPSTHKVLKAVIARYPEDEGKKSRVGGALDNTGVVHGEFGFVEAYREKKNLLQGWLNDERAAVRQYAEDRIRYLDNRIASETRSAENDVAMRRLEFGSGKSDSDED